MDKQHAQLSPSGASRWMTCPASVRETHGAARSIASDAAVRGDRIHHVAEKLLKSESAPDEDADIVCVAKDFCDYIKSHNFKQQWIETRVYVSDDCWGTADVIGVKNDELYIVDLKSGNYPVFAEENPQLMIYAIGALKKFLPEKVFKSIHLIIYQPSIQNFDEFILSQKELFEWRDKALKPSMTAALSENPRYSVGSHCRFCDAKNTCSYRHSTLYKTARDMERKYRESKHGDTVRIIDEIMENYDTLNKWLKDVKDAAYELLSAGVEMDRVYLSPGRKMRAIEDENMFLREMQEQGYDLADLMNVKSVSQLENVVKRDVLQFYTKEVSTSNIVKVRKDAKKRNN